MITNTELVRQPAIHFKKHGFYNNAPAGTKEWEDYWDMQKDRCLNGYSVGDLAVTGYHYWYLNFYPILRVDDNALKGESDKGVRKTKDFPAFWDGDYNYFWAQEIARNGISDEDYNNLGLRINIKQRDGGHHLAVLKARGKGFSYKHGSMLARNYHLIRESKGFAMASEKEYLTKDGLLTKAWDNIQFIDEHTAWRQPRLIDRQIHKMSGYKRNIAGTDVERGQKSQIMGVSLKDDVEKARGKRGELIFFEEAGKLPGLKKAWEVTRPSVEDGAYVAGQIIAFGTGGEEGENIEGLEEIFYNPEAYNAIAINNQWDEGADGTTCSFFFPDTWNFSGFMDGDGNSNVEETREHLEEKRKAKKKAPDPSALSQYVAEHPFTPAEATTQTSTNIFPIAELQAHMNTIKAKGLEKYGVPGKLYYSDKGVKFRPSDKVKPITKYPHGRNQDLSGSVVVYQTPYRNSNGKVPKNLYVACHDPYAHDSSTDMSSLGATFILKRTNRLDQSFSECVVASYVGRPNTQDEYNRIMFMLAEYYNCKIAFENNRGNVVEYAKRMNQLHMLEEQFDVITNVEKQTKSRSNVSRKFGIHMTKTRKEQAEIYVRDWLNEMIGADEEGNTKLRLHNIFDVPLLQELIKFNKKGNFDRVSALFIGMYYLKELHSRKVTEEVESPYEDFFLNQKHFQ